MAVLGLPASANADWVEPVAAPLNAAASSVVYAPGVVDVGGVPYAVIGQQTGSSSQLLVKRLVGSSWQQLGGSLTTASLDAAPVIANVGGTVYVAWSEQRQSGNAAVHVDYWNGSAWVAAGPGPLNLTLSDDASLPSIAAVGGTPYVAFVEGVSPSGPESVIIEQYDSVQNTWSQVGTSRIGLAGDTADGTSLTSLGGVPYVAWSEFDPNAAGCYGSPGQDLVTAQGYSSGAWGHNTVTISGACGMTAPGLATAGSSPTLYLSYIQLDGSHHASLLVNSTDGASWATASSVNDGPVTRPPSITSVGTVPYLAFTQVSPGPLPAVVVKQLNGNSWTLVGSSLTNPRGDSPLGASIASVGGVPFAAWATPQCAANAKAVNAYAASYGAGASNTASTNCPDRPAIVSKSYPGAQQGQPYSIKLEVSGGTAPYAWSASGLPPGLTLDPPSGVVSGTPTSGGSYAASIAVADANGFVAQGTLTIPVSASSTPCSPTSWGCAPTPQLTAPAPYYPPPPARGHDPTPPAQAHADARAFAGVSLAGASLTELANGLVSFKVTCPADTAGGRCDELGVLYASKGTLPPRIAAIAGRRATRLGGKSFTVPAGRSLVVHMRLSRSAQKQLRPHTRLRARLVLVSKSGAGEIKTQEQSVTLVRKR